MVSIISKIVVVFAGIFGTVQVRSDIKERNPNRYPPEFYSPIKGESKNKLTEIKPLKDNNQKKVLFEITENNLESKLEENILKNYLDE